MYEGSLGEYIILEQTVKKRRHLVSGDVITMNLVPLRFLPSGNVSAKNIYSFQAF